MAHTLVVRHAHRTIALVVGHAGSVGAVDWDLQIVGSQSVSMRVGIREETALKKKAQHLHTTAPDRGTERADDCAGSPDHLQHLVRTWLNAWRHVAGVIGHLLHFCKVVAWVPVEDHFTHWDQRVFFMRPNLKDKACKHPLGNFKPSRLRQDKKRAS